MTIKRRHFLMFLGAGAGAIAASCATSQQSPFSNSSGGATGTSSGVAFRPVKGPMSLVTDGIVQVKNRDAAVAKDVVAREVSNYSQYTVVDDLVLPEGYSYQVIATWGDPVGKARFGYNNDYLSLIETAPNEGFLTVNHEYISAVPWIQTYQQVMGKALPFAAVKAAVEKAGEEGVNAFALLDNDPVKGQIREICQAAMSDLGLSVIAVRQDGNGQWVRTNSNADRRISGISGVADGHYLKTTGPATAVFRKTTGIGYIDGLGDRVIGTFSNCAGGTAPWGTVFSGEENFQTYVAEAINADGTPPDPSMVKFRLDDEEVYGLGNVFGLAGHKYGWMVEIDPANPNDYGTKHTWLGRYRHEAVGIRAEAGKKLAMYSGCDRRGGHLYKFVSADTLNDPKDKANSRLLETGMLYAAKFNADGTGRWIPLRADTAVNPDLPSVHAGGMIPLPQRPQGGHYAVKADAEIAKFKQQFKTLGDLYQGNADEKQGAILIDAHYAASAAGATCTARPEDTEIGPNGALFIAFTSGAPSDSDGSPDARIFKGPKGEAPYEYGWIMRLEEENNDPAAMTFRWAMFATGGEPADGGLGFANPDNLAFDQKGNLWVVVDMSSDKTNQAVPAKRVDEQGKELKQSDLRGLYGNNSIWVIPTEGPDAGEAYLFGYGPMECETTGPYFSADHKTLFLAVQHPGEINGVRRDMATEKRQFAMRSLSGQEFMQTREVPIGSNWPGKQANDPPKPSVVVIRRQDGGTLT
jgi:hypothetical protein